MSGTIVMNRAKLIREHRELVNLLAKTINRLVVEYEKQRGELEEYEQGGLIRTPRQRRSKVSYVMDEYKRGKLKSSSGSPVTNPKQAMAIALSESRR